MPPDLLAIAPEHQVHVEQLDGVGLLVIQVSDDGDLESAFK